MDKLTPNQFLKELAEFAESVRLKIEAEVDGFSDDEDAKKERQLRVKGGDFWFFAETYFPHYIKPVDKSEFHEYLSTQLAIISDKSKGHKEVLAAPRGEAKSTIVTQIFSIYCIVRELKHFIGIIMDTYDQAVMMLEGIKAELEVNPRLKMDFPHASGAGRVWQAGKIITTNERMIMIGGAGKKLRGWRFGPHRPDLLILDDIENDENVKSKEQRDKLEKWINKAALKLGPPDGSMDALYIGTILHYDSVLSRTMKKPTWFDKRFQAIIKWPDRMDLWEKWEEILINESADAADQYYKSHKAAMNKGATVSWPGMRPLKLLMEIRADDHDAFDSEMQNDPSNSEDAPFKDIKFWVHCSDWVFYGAVDPSLGKKNKYNDPSAILVGGMNRKTGVLDVIEAKIRRRVPSLIISEVIEFQREYTCLAWAFESVQFQEFMRTELVKQSAILGVPVPALPVIPHTDKDLRIESLQPHIFNSLIRVHRSQTVLIEQLRHWPEADHDDGPDGLEMLWKIAVSGMGGIPKIKTINIREKLRAASAYES